MAKKMKRTKVEIGVPWRPDAPKKIELHWLCPFCHKPLGKVIAHNLLRDCNAKPKVIGETPIGTVFVDADGDLWLNYRYDNTDCDDMPIVSHGIARITTKMAVTEIDNHIASLTNQIHYWREEIRTFVDENP